MGTSIRRFSAIAGSLAVLAISLAISATASAEQQGSPASDIHRLAPAIAGIGAALAIYVLASPIESRMGFFDLTPRWRALIAFAAASVWGAGMFAVAGWILRAEPRCPFVMVEGGRRLAQHDCGGLGAQGFAVLIGVVGGGLIVITAAVLNWRERSRA